MRSAVKGAFAAVLAIAVCLFPRVQAKRHSSAQTADAHSVEASASPVHPRAGYVGDDVCPAPLVRPQPAWSRAYGIRVSAGYFCWISSEKRPIRFGRRMSGGGQRPPAEEAEKQAGKTPLPIRHD